MREKTKEGNEKKGIGSWKRKKRSRKRNEKRSRKRKRNKNDGGIKKGEKVKEDENKELEAGKVEEEKEEMTKRGK